MCESDCRCRSESYSGTAGAMFDFSPAGGLAPTESSFSRIVFSDAAIRLAAMSENDWPFTPLKGARLEVLAALCWIDAPEATKKGDVEVAVACSVRQRLDQGRQADAG